MKSAEELRCHDSSEMKMYGIGNRKTTRTVKKIGLNKNTKW